MSFGFSVGDFIGVLQLANKVRKEFVGAPNRFKDISDEVRSLSIVLHDVDICLSECEISDEQEVHLREISASCERLLRKLEATLDKYVELEGTDTGLRKRARRGWKRIQWEPEDIRDLRDRITANVILLNAFLDSISSRVTFTTKKGVDRLNQRQEDEERLCICDWLTPIEYAPQQQDFLNRRQPGTGQWLLDSKQYQLWLATPGQILFCPGIPGAGKTILTAIAIEDLTTRYRERPEIGIAYTYFNFRRRDEQKVGHLLASILKQLGRIQPSLPVPVRALWDNHKEKQTRPSVEEISHALHLVSSLYKSVFIVIDALDECQTSDGCRTQFITEVLKLQNGYNANVFVTSRFIPEIVDKFRNTNNTTNLEIQACRQDIEAYIEGNLVELPSFVQRNKNLQIDIKNAISEAVDGMFLLAQIYLRSLDDKPTTKAVRNALQQFQGQGRVSASEDSRAMVLSRAYDQAMERINGQMAGFRDLARRVLSWITCSKRPLTVMELRHALAVEIGERELDEENLPEAEDMVSVCAGLVTVDDESDTIRLVHYTAQEYLERTLELWYPKAETEITRVCVTYLSFETFESGFCRIADDFRKQLQSNPFYDYAIHYWGYHARKAPDALSETVAFLSCQPKVDPAGQGAMIVGGLWGYVVMESTGDDWIAFGGVLWIGQRCESSLRTRI
ncbi:hypothetical protein GGR58DRAFT_252203 [Xylaria digitata]|nr:hypothetical protein GGR58DRAFT_252203 [Xylaria digitata]